MSQRKFLCALLCFGALLSVQSRHMEPGTFNLTSSDINIAEGKTLSNAGTPEPLGRSLFLKSLFLAPVGLALIFIAFMTLLLPIPAISTGKSFPDKEGSKNRALEMAKILMEQDECLERISCEISRFSRRYKITSWVPESIENYMKSSRWETKLSRGIHMKNTCRTFKCTPSKSFSKL